MCSSVDLYDFVIPEDLPLGKMGGKVKANDRDYGDNAKSTYSIIEGDDQGVFEIVTDTQTQEGILKLKKVSVKTLQNVNLSPSRVLKSFCTPVVPKIHVCPPSLGKKL